MCRRRVLGWGLVLVGCGFDSDGSGIADEIGESASNDAMTGSSSTASTNGDGASSGNDAGSGMSASSTAATQGESETTGDAPGTTTGPAVDCTVDNGGCDPNATCSEAEGAATCQCDPGYVGDGFTCSVEPTLQTLRIEMGCSNRSGCQPDYCVTPIEAGHARTLSADAEVTYDVTLRVRGVVEQKTYNGGSTDGYWNEGGTPNDDDWNVYVLEVSDPQQAYFLNAGNSFNPYCDGLDYEQTIPIRGGATVRLRMPANGPCSTRNEDAFGDAIVVIGVPPAPNAFNGQFIQIDATDIVAPPP